MHKTERPLILLIQAGNCFATFLISFSGFPRIRHAIEKALENFRLFLVRKDFLFDPFRFRIIHVALDLRPFWRLDHFKSSSLKVSGIPCEKYVLCKSYFQNIDSQLL